MLEKEVVKYIVKFGIGEIFWLDYWFGMWLVLMLIEFWVDWLFCLYDCVFFICVIF